MEHMMETGFAAFDGWTRIAAGERIEVEECVREHAKRFPHAGILIFDLGTGMQTDFAARVVPEEASPEAPADAVSGQKRGRGRPRLGVQCGELCLLPRQWEWLSEQPRSASATVRRLIDDARRNGSEEGRRMARIAAADRFLWAIAGDLPGFEEASRALYARSWEQFWELIAPWPEDIRTQVSEILERDIH